jgi:hypothetical protein
MWYFYLAYFIAGFFLVNGIPHFVNGISGRKFQSPFAKPPGVGESSAVLNVIWGLVNFIVGYALVWAVGDFKCGFTMDMLMLGLGVVVGAIALAWWFSRVRKG